LGSKIEGALVMFELTDAEKTKYDELTALAGTGSMSDAHRLEWSDLGNKYAVYLKWKAEDDAAKNVERLAKEAEMKRTAGRQADIDRDLGHQMSWLKAALPDIKAGDDDLKTQWLLFKGKVGAA